MSVFDKFLKRSQKVTAQPTEAAAKSSKLKKAFAIGVLAVVVPASILTGTRIYGDIVNYSAEDNLRSYLQEQNIPEKVADWVGKPVHIVERDKFESAGDWYRGYAQYLAQAQLGPMQFIRAYEGFGSVRNERGAFVMGRTNYRGMKMAFMPIEASEERWLERLGGIDVKLEGQKGLITPEQATQSVIIHELGHAKGDTPNPEIVDQVTEHIQWGENRADLSILEFKEDLGLTDEYIERFAAARMASEIMPFKLDFYDHMKGTHYHFQEKEHMTWQSGHATSMVLHDYLETGYIPNDQELSELIDEHHREVGDLVQKISDHLGADSIERKKGYQVEVAKTLIELQATGTLSEYQDRFANRYVRSIEILNPELGAKIFAAEVEAPAVEKEQPKRSHPRMRR